MRFLTVVILIGLVACRPAQGDRDSATPPRSSSVTISLDRATYAVGATAQVTAINGSVLVLGFNQCSSRVIERQQGNDWAAIPEPGRMCTMELRLLNPKETQTFSTTLPQNASRGTYRMVLNFSRQGPASGDQQPNTAIQAYSQPFQIE